MKQPPDSGRLVYAPAKVTAVLSDNAQEDFENAEGRRVGDQELEIQILSGDHKDEIMTVTNYMSALFNVDVQQGDRIIVRIMTDENGSYYASVFNYDRGIVLGGFLLIFFILLATLGGKKGLGALAGASAYSGLHLVYPDSLPAPWRPGDTGNHCCVGCVGGSGADLLKRIFKEDILCSLRLCRRRPCVRHCCGSGWVPFSYEWI